MEIESFTMRVWILEQWSDAIADKYLPEASKEQGQIMVLRLAFFYPLCPPTEGNGSRDILLRTGDLSTRGEENMQLRGDPTIQEENSLLGMVVQFNVRPLSR